MNQLSIVGLIHNDAECSNNNEDILLIYSKCLFYSMYELYITLITSLLQLGQLLCINIILYIVMDP